MSSFSSSKNLAQWTAEILSVRDIDSLSRWRMLEHWMQPEIYRAVELGKAGAWRHLGEGEQPYFTAIPRKTSSFEIKWIDLVFARPSLECPQQIIWFELKHIGRSQARLKANASDLGNDTAALYALDPIKTSNVWLNPPSSVINASKIDLWNRYGPGIREASHIFAQIVLAPRPLVDVSGNECLIKNSWIKTFEKNTGIQRGTHDLGIERANTGKFAIFTLIGTPRLGSPITKVIAPQLSSVNREQSSTYISYNMFKL